MAHFYNSCLLPMLNVTVSSPKSQLFLLSPLCLQTQLIYITSHHSTIEHRASTGILHLTVFLASVLISIQVFLTLLACSSTILSPLCLQTRLMYITSCHSYCYFNVILKCEICCTLLGLVCHLFWSVPSLYIWPSRYVYFHFGMLWDTLTFRSLMSTIVDVPQR